MNRMGGEVDPLPLQTWRLKRMETLLTLQETARLFKISPSTLRRWVRHKKIPHQRIEGFLRFQESELHAWVQSRSVKPEASLSPFRKVQRELRSLTTQHTLAVLEKG